LGFLSVAGMGLSYSGWLRVEPFAGGAILWLAAFIAVFILYPLAVVLTTSVWVRDEFTLDVFRQTLRSPTFFLFENPWTEISGRRVALWVGSLAAVLAFPLQSLWGDIPLARQALRSVIIGLGAYCLSALSTGFGALRNSVLLALSVGVLSTALGLAFALLAQRSRFPIRSLMGPFSTLSMITPPFVLGLSMIYMFGRQGLITNQLLGLSTNAF